MDLFYLPPDGNIHGSHRDWKTGRHFPVRQKSGNFYETGKVREFYSKYWKNKEFNQLTILWK